MIYWMKRNKGGSGIPDSVSIMSKSEILREIVTEKLTTAAQEIFAVVERTVAGYEEEASGLRQEIDRQRRQLEAVLQPRVKLERREGQIPLVEGHETVVSLEEEEQTQQSDVEVSMSPGPWDDNDDDDGGDNEDNEEGDRGEEEQQLSAPPAASPRREDLKDPGNQIKLRKRASKPQVSETQSHIELKIRVLKDSQISMFSISGLYTLPVQELQCPRGLQEKDFLDLLRSTFPQLADQRQFDLCTFGRSRMPQPLRVKTLTPEQIYKRLIKARTTYLFLLLKTGEDPQRILHPVERRDDSLSSCASTSADQTQMIRRSQKRRRRKPQISDTLSHIDLKIRLLEDSKGNVQSKAGLYNLPVHELQCPRGLQETDFLDLLRSSLPQLSDQKQFDLCTFGRSMKLQPLSVKTLTPEEIYNQLIKARKTYLFLLLKTKKDPQSSSEDPVDDSPSSSASTLADETEMNPSCSTSQQQDMETEEAGDEDAAESQVDSSDDDDKGGDEAFDRDDDWKPDPELQSPKKRRRKRESKLSGVKGQSIGSSKTACKVCGVWYRNLGSLISHALSHVEKSKLVCGVCGEQFESVEELKGHLRNYQKSYDCSYCGKSFLTKTSLNSHTTVHTGDRPFKCDVCNKTFAQFSTLNVHRWVHVADKPYKCDICLKAFGLKTQLKAHIKMHAGRDKYHCNVCGKSLADWRSLTCHKLIHSGERRYGCKVCGKRFKLPKTLKAHEKVHTSRDRPYLCNICCKTFVTNQSLTAHMGTHANERPFTCSICNKGFVSKGDLNVHMCVHTSEAPHSCSECGRRFKHKFHLNSHKRSHLGDKRFVCGDCGKAFSRKNHLASHMRSHNRKRPYQRTVRNKTFPQGHCL